MICMKFKMGQNANQVCNRIMVGVSQSIVFGKTHVEVHRSMELINKGAKWCRSMEIPRNNVPSSVDQWRSTLC